MENEMFFQNVALVALNKVSFAMENNNFLSKIFINTDLIFVGQATAVDCEHNSISSSRSNNDHCLFSRKPFILFVFEAFKGNQSNSPPHCDKHRGSRPTKSFSSFISFLFSRCDDQECSVDCFSGVAPIDDQWRDFDWIDSERVLVVLQWIFSLGGRRLSWMPLPTRS